MADAPSKLDPSTLERAQRALRRRDPQLGEVIKRVGPCRLAPGGSPYDSLLRSVVHQQLAGGAARAIELRFRAAYGGRFPRPGRLLGATPAQLRDLGLSQRKAETLLRIAEAFEDGRLSSRRLRGADESRVIESLTALKGIGTWTAHMILIFSLGRPDILPVGDYGIRKGAWAIYGLEDLPRPAQLEALAECWRPYRSVASWYLWRVADEVGSRKPSASPPAATPRGRRRSQA